MASARRRIASAAYRGNDLKIKLDENLPAKLKTMLHSVGHEVSDVIEEGLSGSPDPEVLAAAATSEERVLMTFDADFADVRNYPLNTHAGIVVFLLEDQRWQSLEGSVARLLESEDFSRLEGGLAIVEERRVRYKRTKKRRNK